MHADIFVFNHDAAGLRQRCRDVKRLSGIDGRGAQATAHFGTSMQASHSMHSLALNTV